jgi:hypothetical protein
MSKEIEEREGLPEAVDFGLPSSGIEEIDRALFNLFDKTLPFQVKIDDQSTKVPVVFSTGERFALTRRNSPIRDRNNAIILPIIALYRKSIDLSPGQGGYGTPISPRDQSTYVVRKRLSKKDRNYQNLINRFGIKNQENVSSRENFARSDVFPGNIAKPGTVVTRRNGKNLSFIANSQTTSLDNSLTDNIFEIITAPYPTFMLISYEIVFWTQYVQNMNQLLEVMISKFSGQDIGFKIQSPSGFEYTAFVKSPLNTDDNFNDFSKDERIIKFNFTIDVPGYLFAPDHEGLSSPFRVYESAPQIEFGYSQVDGFVFTTSKNPDDVVNQDKFVLSEIESKSMTSLRRGQTSADVVEIIENPFTSEPSTKVSKIRIRNERAGETVASSRIAIDLQTTLDSPSSE